jgi:glycerol-3-phosphate dehydrogenase (NAD(P)+)
MAKISILGAGSWGIALSVLLNKNGHAVTVWSPFPDEINMLKNKHEYAGKLPGVIIPESLELTIDLQEASLDKDLLIIATPSQKTREVATKLAGHIPEGQKVMTVSKGIEEETLLTLVEVIEECAPKAEAAVMSGPSHAEEVGQGLPTAIVIGARKKATAEYLQNLFMSETFRVYVSPDILGIELGGSLKNVVALAAGIADGLGYGDNTKAALITRGIREIARLGTAMGGKAETFYGLTGIGDLIVTCASMHSRNRRAGILIGKGYTMEQAMTEVSMVVEGVFSAKAAMALAQKYQVEMPIIEQVNEVLFHNKPADQAVKELMIRDKKIEISDIPWNES